MLFGAAVQAADDKDALFEVDDTSESRPPVLYDSLCATCWAEGAVGTAHVKRRVDEHQRQAPALEEELPTCRERVGKVDGVSEHAQEQASLEHM